jgi:hypothetical protein
MVEGAVCARAAAFPPEDVHLRNSALDAPFQREARGLQRSGLTQASFDRAQIRPVGRR